MLGLFISNAYAMGAPSSGGSGGDMPFFANPLFFMIVVFGVFYFFILRPQQQERKKLEQRLKSIKVGDKIITSGGIHGIVTNASGDPVKVKIADNVKVDISRSAVISVQSSGTEIEDDSKKAK